MRGLTEHVAYERGFVAEVEGYWPPAPSSEGAEEGSFSVCTSPACEHALAERPMMRGSRWGVNCYKGIWSSPMKAWVVEGPFG